MLMFSVRLRAISIDITLEEVSVASGGEAARTSGELRLRPGCSFGEIATAREMELLGSGCWLFLRREGGTWSALAGVRRGGKGRVRRSVVVSWRRCTCMTSPARYYSRNCISRARMM